MTDDLQFEGDTVALESTGVYWIPMYEVLEQRRLKVWLVDARQVKYEPGRKIDVQDGLWLQKLMSHELQRTAFRPTADVCVIRAVACQREVLLTSQTSWVQRTPKALVEMNILLTEVIRDIVVGQRAPKVLALHRHRRVKANEQDIARALTGNLREEHLFVLKQALLTERSAASVNQGKASRAGSKIHMEFDARQQLANWVSVDLTRINGLGLNSVMKILSEIGIDLSRFDYDRHFCSWLALSPLTKIGGNKVISARTKRSAYRVRQALKMAAMTPSHSDSALGEFYRRLCSRVDKPRANIATAHKLARMVYFMLACDEALVDEGQQRYEELQRWASRSTPWGLNENSRPYFCFLK